MYLLRLLCLNTVTPNPLSPLLPQCFILFKYSKMQTIFMILNNRWELSFECTIITVIGNILKFLLEPPFSVMTFYLIVVIKRTFTLPVHTMDLVVFQWGVISDLCYCLLNHFIPNRKWWISSNSLINFYLQLIDNTKKTCVEVHTCIIVVEY